MSASARGEAIEALAQAEHLLAAGQVGDAANVLREARERLVSPRLQQFNRHLLRLRDRDRSERKAAICELMDISSATYYRLLSQSHKL